MKSKVLAVTLVCCLFLVLAGAAVAGFSDISGHWAQEQVQAWTDKGLVEGYPDGTFHPDKAVTRAEFVALVNRAMKKQSPEATADFKDVKASDWFYREVATAVEAGYVDGYEDKTFRPNQAITRQEAASMSARLLKLEKGDPAVLDKFKDAAQIGSWAKENLAAVVDRDLIKGYPDGTFGPTRSITRAEAVVVLDRAASGVTPPPGETVKVTGVKLDKNTLSISVGSTAQLKATISPDNATDKKVTWATSDEEIATVDSEGKVKGIKAGEATVTVTTADGGFKDTCAVTVSRSGGGGGGGGGSTTVSVTGVSLDQTSLTMTVGGTATLTATVAPDNATNKSVTWSSDKPAVATVDAGGKVTAVAPGMATVTVKTADGDKTATCVVTVTAALPAEIASYTRLIDPLGNTVVRVTIKPEYAEEIASVTVKGLVMNRQPGTNVWQKTLEGAVTVADADFTVTLKQADFIDKTDAILGFFGDTNVYVWLKNGVTATGVTANGTPMSYSEGKYKVVLWNLHAGDKVTVEVTTAEGRQTREVVIRKI